MKLYSKSSPNIELWKILSIIGIFGQVFYCNSGGMSHGKRYYDLEDYKPKTLNY